MLSRFLNSYCLAIVATLALAGCGTSLQPEKALTLEVTGTAGVRLTGEYIVRSGAGSIRHEIDREVPFSIDMTGHQLSCVIQKLGDKGTVRVQILVDGERVAFAWTKDAFGNVSVASP